VRLLLTESLLCRRSARGLDCWVARWGSQLRSSSSRLKPTRVSRSVIDGACWIHHRHDGADRLAFGLAPAYRRRRGSVEAIKEQGAARPRPAGMSLASALVVCALSCLVVAAALFLAPSPGWRHSISGSIHAAFLSSRWMRSGCRRAGAAHALLSGPGQREALPGVRRRALLRDAGERSHVGNRLEVPVACPV